MIFVTVGTHEQSFNRLVKYMDELKKEHVIKEDVFIQTGYSTYEPQFCKWSALLSYQEMVQRVKEAHIIITHGGPSSFIMPLQIGKIPIIVPRRKVFDEHVNDHQIEFIKAIANRIGTIIPVFNIDDLKEILLNYDSIISNMSSNMLSNNKKFNEEFEKIVETLIIKK